MFLTLILLDVFNLSLTKIEVFLPAHQNILIFHEENAVVPSALYMWYIQKYEIIIFFNKQALLAYLDLNQNGT